MTRADGPSRRRPSAWWYLLVVLLPIGGCALTVSQMAEEARTINERVAALPRASASGESKIGLAKGSSAIFFVSPTTSNGSELTTGKSTDDRGEPSPVDCSLVDPFGQKVNLEPPGTTTRFTANHLEGRLVYQVEHPRAGFYQLTCSYSAAGKLHASPGDAIVFVSGDFFKDLAMPLLPGIVGVLAGIAAWVLVFFSRRRAS